jgi:hypothetical protein
MQQQCRRYVRKIFKTLTQVCHSSLSGSGNASYQNALAINDCPINAASSSSPLILVYQRYPQSLDHITASGDHNNPTFIHPPRLSNNRFPPTTNAIAEYNLQLDSLQLGGLQLDGSQFDGLQFDDFGGLNPIDDFIGHDLIDNFTPTSTNAFELNYSASSDIQPSATAFADLPAPTTSITTAADSANANTNLYRCDYTGCTTTFVRAGDLLRHTKKHFPGEHPCLVDNCDRKGDKAFYRLDKLRDHQRQKHRMAV